MQKRRMILLLLVSLLVFNLFVVAKADEANKNTKEYVKWSTLSGKGTENLKSVAYGSGRFVAVGSGGIIQVSEDGVKWRKVDWSNPMELHQVASNGNLFIAVGDQMIFKSADGLKWEKALELQNKVDYGYDYNPRLLNILWDGDCFYAFGQGRFYSSTDGTVWKQCYESEISHDSTAFNGTTIDSLASSKDKVVVMAIENNFRIIMASEDGSTWVKKNAPDIAYPANPHVYFNGKYFISLGREALIYSENGINWTIKKEKLPFGLLRWVKKISGMYYGSNGKSLYKSADGFAWEETGLAGSNIEINDIASDGKETLVVVGDSGMIQQYGKNGIWTSTGTDVYYSINSAATDGKVMAAVGDYGQILITEDGNKWDRVKAVTDKSMQYVVYAEKRFVAAGEGGEILVSSNGYQWHKAENHTNTTIRAIAYGAGRFAAVGDGGVLIVSEDGEKWKQLELNLNGYSIDGVVFNGKSFLAVTSKFTLRSTDGLNWERLSSNSFVTPQRKIYDFSSNDKGNSLIWDGKRVLVSTEGVIAQTDNGEKWTYASAAPYWGKPLYYESNLYFSGIYTSIDAVSWEPTGSNLNPDDINSFASFKSKLYAFGIKGMILKGEILSRPEPADISYIWADTPFVAPIQLEGIKQAAKNGRLCLPADIIGGLIEAQLKTGSNGSYKLSKNGMSIDFKVESSTAYINGKAEKLPASCYLEGKRLMVPAAFVFDKFGIKLEYNNVSKIMTLSRKK